MRKEEVPGGFPSPGEGRDAARHQVSAGTAASRPCYWVRGYMRCRRVLASSGRVEQTLSPTRCLTAVTYSCCHTFHTRAVALDSLLSYRSPLPVCKASRQVPGGLRAAARHAHPHPCPLPAKLLLVSLTLAVCTAPRRVPSGLRAAALPAGAGAEGLGRTGARNKGAWGLCASVSEWLSDRMGGHQHMVNHY